ncbi:MAG: glutamate--tRNA ligase [Actinomycetota bacterium]|nr:glutamate--tRNA ligase [Actinomycetota bacterium]
MNRENKNTRVRFAPSPTGYLHIGSARTAFFNWLYAKNTGGSFILRIEDTDISRHREESIDKILNSLKWLGIDWDEGPGAEDRYGPYRQSQRTGIYNDYARRLIEEKKAYRCFCTPEELEEKRRAAAGKGISYRYDRKCLNLTQEEVKSNLEKGKPYAIRLRVPENEIISFKDKVYGEIKVESENIEDFIIIRSNGLPTYNYSAAIDDALMKITGVIRGEDHLSNTPKQILVYRALGFKTPDFTHLPMILGMDGQKLSKRHGSISIEKYIEGGFLRGAILNYLALLGWSYGEKTTIFSVDELIKKFNLSSINKKPAKFDYSKLLWINGQYIKNMPDPGLSELIKIRMENFISLKDKNLLEDSAPELEEKILKITPLVKERIKTLNDSIELAAPFFIKISYSDEFRTYFENKKIDAVDTLERVYKALEKKDEDLCAGYAEKVLRSLSDELGISLRKIAEVVRIALWNNKVSPPLFGTIEILGREITLRRIKKYMEIIS